MTSDLPTQALDRDSLRVVYMGTPEFAVPALEALVASRHRVVGVITNPDRRAGRGNRLCQPPVKEAAVAHEIEVYQPKSMRTDEAAERLRAWEPDVAVVAAYGQILPPEILEIPEFGCINIHASLLPAYRGAAPINWCIVEGEERSGITIMQMDEGLDTGPILLAEPVPIPAGETAQGLHDRLAPLGARLIVEALDRLCRGELTATPQDDDEASYAPMLCRQDGRIDWRQPAERIVDTIRGFHPWPGACATLARADGATERIKLHCARAVEGQGDPGEVLEVSPADGALVVAAGRGAVALERLQAPGRCALDTRDFLNGFEIEADEHFVPCSGAETD
jgi:methionyl-tRNA formyltransferase